MPDFELLKKLCALDGISGDEKNVRDFIIEQITPYAESVKVDPLGNVLARKKGRKRAEKRLMFSAHMDEVGLMVTDITSDGYLKFDEVGGIDKRILPGKRVTVGEKNLPGVIGVKPIHLTKGDESSAVPDYSEMYIDIGARSREDAEKYVTLGDSVRYTYDFTETESKICCKAIDDRFGCLVLIELIQKELEYDADFAFVVQEEVGLRGSTVAAYTLNPEYAVVVETTTAADIPESDRKVCVLGDGAVISVMDRHTIYDKELVKAAFSLAEKHSIPAQYKRAVAGGNDSGAIHKSRGGVRTLAVSLPCRYLHAPSCFADKRDCESVFRLAEKLADFICSGDNTLD